MTFGEYLRTQRKARNETQAQFAKRLGLSPYTVGNYERDQREPNPYAIKRICEELNVGSYRELLREVYGR